MDEAAYNQYLNNLSTISANQATQPTQQPQQSQPAAAPAHQPSWWQKLLPAVGGVGGGILGTLIAGPVGGIAGAALGGSVGQGAENATEGKAVLQGNDLTSGLENGVGQAVGLGAGKIIGGVGGALAKTGANMGEKTAQTAADEAATKVYGAIPKGLRQAHDMNGSLELAGKLGIDTTNPQTLVDTGKTANEILTNGLNDAIGQSGTLDASSYNDIVKKAIAARSGVLGSYEPVALSKARLGTPSTPAAKLLQQLQGYGMGVAKENADPTQIRGLLQQVGKAYGDAKPTVTAMTGAVDPVQAATHETLGDVYNNLKTMVYDRPEVAANIKALPGNIQAADVGGNQLLADHLNTIISGADHHQPMLDALQKFGNLQNVGKDAITAGKGVVVGPEPAGDLATGATNVAAGTLAMGGHPSAIPIAIAKNLHATGMTPKVVEGMGNIMTKTAPLAAPAATLQSNIPNIAAASVPGAGGAAPQGGANMQPGQQPVNPVNDLYNTLMTQELAAPTVLGPSLVGTLSSLAPAVQKNQLAADTLQNMLPTYQNAGGAQGLGGGLLSRLTGLIPGTAANTYQNEQQAAATQLAAALGITPQAAMAMLPSLMNNPNVAQQQLQGTGSVLNTLTAGS